MASISVYLLGVTSSAQAAIDCLGVIQLPGGRQNSVKVFTGLGVCEINKRNGERDSESHLNHRGPAKVLGNFYIEFVNKARFSLWEGLSRTTIIMHLF